MTTTSTVLIAAKYAENSQTGQYTATNCTAIIDKFTVTNISAGNETISVNIVASAGTASDANLILDDRALAPGETYTCPELVGHTLTNGMFISTLASAASALVIRASGRQITT